MVIGAKANDRPYNSFLFVIVVISNRQNLSPLLGTLVKSVSKIWIGSQGSLPRTAVAWYFGGVVVPLKSTHPKKPWEHIISWIVGIRFSKRTVALLFKNHGAQGYMKPPKHFKAFFKGQLLGKGPLFWIIVRIRKVKIPLIFPPLKATEVFV